MVGVVQVSIEFFGGYLVKFYIIVIDDVYVFFPDEASHAIHLWNLLESLREHVLLAECLK